MSIVVIINVVCSLEKQQLSGGVEIAQSCVLPNLCCLILVITNLLEIVIVNQLLLFNEP